MFSCVKFTFTLHYKGKLYFLNNITGHIQVISPLSVCSAHGDLLKNIILQYIFVCTLARNLFNVTCAGLSAFFKQSLLDNNNFRIINNIKLFFNFSKTFSAQGNLQTHLKIHTGQKDHVSR